MHRDWGHPHHIAPIRGTAHPWAIFLSWARMYTGSNVSGTPGYVSGERVSEAYLYPIRVGYTIRTPGVSVHHISEPVPATTICQSIGQGAVQPQRHNLLTTVLMSCRITTGNSKQKQHKHRAGKLVDFFIHWLPMTRGIQRRS